MSKYAVTGERKGTRIRILCSEKKQQKPNKKSWYAQSEIHSIPERVIIPSKIISK